MFKRSVILLSAASLLLITGCGKKNETTAKKEPVAEKKKDETKAKPKTRVFFVKPKDGATVKTETEIEFGLEGMTISPAGKDIKDTTKGHHHLIIDGKPIPYGGLVPADSQHLHFGKGQTSTKVTLPPGKRTLTMQFADGLHRSYGKAMSATITVNVVGKPKPASQPTSKPTSPPTSKPTGATGAK